MPHIALAKDRKRKAEEIRSSGFSLRCLNAFSLRGGKKGISLFKAFCITSDGKKKKTEERARQTQSASFSWAAGKRKKKKRGDYKTVYFTT